MADITQVGPPDLSVGYGNAGSAGYYGLQQELLRRSALARQAQLDEEQRQRDILDAEVKRENMATLAEQRKAVALENTAKTNALQSTQFTSTHEPGDALAPEDKAIALHLFGPGAVNTTPAVPAMMGGGPIENPTPEDLAASPVTSAVPEKTTFVGSSAQRSDEEHKKMAKAILNGDYDTGNETLDQFNHARALEFLSSGKEGGSIPAGVITPKTQSEKDSTRYFNTRSAQALKKPVPPEDVAFADAYEKIHPTEATKQRDRIEIQLKGIEATDTRQQRGFANSAAEETYKELGKSYGDLNIPKITKLLETLNSPGGVNDVVAVPEFLSSLAGGQGAGLRMSQAELNMIQNARPLLDSLVLKAGNIVGLNKEGYAALTDQQRAQMTKLIREVAQHNYDLGQSYIDAQDRVNMAKDATEVRNIRSDIKRKELELFGTTAGIKKTTGAGGFDSDAARKKYNY